MKLDILSAKTITHQLRWFVLIMEMETSSWCVDMSKKLRHIELTAIRLIIQSTTITWIINLMTSNFIDSQFWEDSEPDHEIHVILIYQEWDLIFTVKTSVCWVTVRSVERTHILKMESIISFYRDTKYPLEISLIWTGYLGRPL